MAQSALTTEPDTITECPEEYQSLIHLVLENENIFTEENEDENIAIQSDKIDYPALIEAIAQVESNKNPKAVSPKGNYIGYLQISKGLVDGCNRILGKKKYTYKDRYDVEKSKEMFYIIQKRYNPNDDLVLAIKIWKEGVGSVNKKRTVTPYVRKVLNLYEKYTE